MNRSRKTPRHPKSFQQFIRFDSDSEDEYECLSDEEVAFHDEFENAALDHHASTGEEEDEEPIVEESIDSRNGPCRFTWEQVDWDETLRGRQFRPCGPVGSRLRGTSVDTELNSFFSFLPEEFWSEVVQFSNSRENRKGNYILTLPKLYRYHSICINIALVGTKCINKLWEEDTQYYNKTVASTLRRWEFWRINSILRVLNIENYESDDNLCKIRFMFQELKMRCIKSYNPPKHFSCDEASPGYYGRCKLKTWSSSPASKRTEKRCSHMY